MNVFIARCDRDLPFGRRELDGVGEEVIEDLLEAAGVSGDERHIGHDVQLQLDVFLLGEGTHEVGHGFADVGDVDLFLAENEFTRLDLGEIEQVVDQVEELLIAVDGRFRSKRSCLASPPVLAVSPMRSAKPMMAFSGVRSSLCVTLVRNSDFKRVGFEESSTLDWASST